MANIRRIPASGSLLAVENPSTRASQYSKLSRQVRQGESGRKDRDLQRAQQGSSDSPAQLCNEFHGPVRSPNTLLIDDDPAHAERTVRLLESRHLAVKIVASQHAVESLRAEVSRYEVIVVHASDNRHAWINFIDSLMAACRKPTDVSAVRFICISTRRREPRFEIQLEGRGVRYVFEP